MKSKTFILAALFSLSAFGQHENSLGERGMIAAPKVSYGTSLPVSLSQQGGYIPSKATASLASAPPPVAGSSYSPMMISTDAKPTSVAATSGGGGGGGGGSKDGYMGGQGKGGAGAGAGAGGGAAGQGAGNENPQQDPEKVGQQGQQGKPGQQGQPGQQGPQGAPGQSGQAAQGPVSGNGGNSGSAPQTAQAASPTPSRKPAAVPAATESVVKEPVKLTDEQFTEQLRLYRDYRAKGETDRAQAVLEALSKVAQPGAQTAAMDTLKENPGAIDEPKDGSGKPAESKPEKASDSDLVT